MLRNRRMVPSKTNSPAQAAAAYVAKCLERGVSPCSKLVQVLHSGSSTVRVGGSAAAPFLAALGCGELTHVTNVDLSGERLRRNALNELATVLCASDMAQVNTLNLVGAKIGDSGLALLLAALYKAGPESALRDLNLRGNRLSSKSATAIAAAFLATKNRPFAQLQKLDVANNNMGHRGTEGLKQVIASLPRQNVELHADGNLLVIEVLNGITHGIGVVMAIVAGIALVVKAMPVLPYYQTISIGLFCVSLMTMFLSSCLYHSFFRFPLIRDILHTADHCSIFLLIAGSYTPFVACYALDPPSTSGPFVLIAVWVCAIFGVLMSFNIIPASRTVRSSFALAMGWIGIIPVRLLLERMPRSIIAGVVGGGLAYSGGIVFYICGKNAPALHVVWHLAVMLGGSLHYMALWRHCNLQAL